MAMQVYQILYDKFEDDDRITEVCEYVEGSNVDLGVVAARMQVRADGIGWELKEVRHVLNVVECLSEEEG